MSTQEPTQRKVFIQQALMAENTVKVWGHVPRLLALDGGGVRGLSSLLIIEQLMKEV